MNIRKTVIMKHLSTTLKIILLGLVVSGLLLEHWWEGYLTYLSDPLEGRVGNFVNAILHFLAFALSTNLIILLLIALYRRSKKLKPKQVDNMVVGLQNIYYLILAFAIILTVAASFGFAPRELFTSLSIVAAAIAIISKEYISEIISGMIIAFSHELSIDDYVKIGGQKGKIIDITLTKIALLNDDDDILFLPNNRVFTSEIVNYTRKEIKKVSIEFELNIQALKTVEELEKDLIQALADYREHIQPGSYLLKIVEIRKDSLSLKFQYVLDQINRELEREIRRKTVRRVVNYVKQNLPGASTVAEKPKTLTGSLERQEPVRPPREELYAP